MRDVRRSSMAPTQGSAPESEAAILSRALGLTTREGEVLVFVADGKTNTEIATILGISASTVATHLRSILMKLGVERRTGAAVQALKALHAHLNAPPGSAGSGRSSRTAAPRRNGVVRDA